MTSDLDSIHVDLIDKFDPAKHPRNPKGTPAGGQFTSGGTKQEESIAPQKPKTLKEAGDRIFVYLSRHGFSFPNKPFVVVVPPAQLTGGNPDVLKGRAPLGEALPGGEVLISRAVAGAPDPQTVAYVLHELLHETVTGGYPENPTVRQMQATEQAVDTMTYDLLPGVLKDLGLAGFDASGVEIIAEPGYRTLVTNLRKASAKATGTPWTSKAARAWRAQQFLKDPSLRDLIQ